LSTHDGGYAEYLLVPHERYLVRLSTLKPEQAAPLTDAALTPYRAIKKALHVLEPDYSVLLIGFGGLGQFGLKLLKLMTAAPVVVADVSEDKLRLARQMGAAHVVNAKDPKLATNIRDLTCGRGVSATFDFVGSDDTLALAVAATRSLGKVSQIGLAGGAARMKVLENTRFEVQFEATLWGTIKELREVIALAESGQLSPIAVELVPLERINDVYTRLKRGEVEGRAVIAPALA
jgi:propanol-preferring alcohol dehydrogenase